MLRLEFVHWVNRLFIGIELSNAVMELKNSSEPLNAFGIEAEQP